MQFDQLIITVNATPNSPGKSSYPAKAQKADIPWKGIYGQ